MKVIPTFPTELFEFKNTELDNDALIPLCEQYADHVKHSDTISSMRNLHDKKELNPLFTWINDCIKQVHVQQKFDCDGFKITSSWFNRALPREGMRLQYHRHSMSFLSGVYYVTEGAATVFEDPVKHRTEAQLEVLRHDYSPHWFSDAEAGKLILFPSWLFHSSTPHFGEKDRYIISFNTMPYGDINFNLATDSVASLEVHTKEKK